MRFLPTYLIPPGTVDTAIYTSPTADLSVINDAWEVAVVTANDTSPGLTVTVQTSDDIPPNGGDPCYVAADGTSVSWTPTNWRSAAQATISSNGLQTLTGPSTSRWLRVVTTASMGTKGTIQATLMAKGTF